MSTAAHGERLHGLLHVIEGAAAELRRRGLSDRTAMRFATYHALIADGHDPRDAFAFANEYFPPVTQPERGLP